jgi:3-oxoacyl-[acyl-carrier-protein] synthase II
MIHNEKKQQVVISGLGIFTPLGRTASQVCEAVLNGDSSIKKSQNINDVQLLSELTSEFLTNDTFDLSSALTKKTDRGVWFTIKALQEAMQSAGLKAEDIDSQRTAVVVGTSHSGIQHVEKIVKTVLVDSGEVLSSNDFYAALTDHVATQVCEYLNLQSIKVTISSACSSSNTAIGYGRDLLLSGDADRVIVIGTDTLSESIVAGFNSLKVLSKSPAAPFSSPSGISLGEGAGVIILESLASTEIRGRQHRGEILGYALSSDAYHQTSVDENGEGIASAITHAMNNAGVKSSDIDYISAHGTGTDSNDVPESKAVERLFGNNIKISSVKSSVGHTLGASGVVELIISLVCSEKGYYPPNNHFTEPRGGCADLDYVHGEQTQSKINTILCNNYGFGGNNSSLVVSRQAGMFHKKATSQNRIFISAYGNYLGEKVPTDWTQLDGIETRLSQNNQDYNSYVGNITLPKGRKSGGRRSSPSIQFSIKATENAVDEFKLGPLLAEHTHGTGIVAGLLHGAQKSLEKYMASVYLDGLAYASSTQFPLTTLNAAAGAVSIKFGIKGFNSTLCGPVGSMKFAVDAVKMNHQDRVFNFSSDELTPMVLELGSKLNAIGQFQNGKPGTGFYFSEGASLSLIESEKALQARGGVALAEIAALKVGQDGQGHTLSGNGNGLTSVARQALSAAKISPNDVDLVIGVGQGTKAFIQNERNALAQIFETKLPTLTSVAMHLGYAPTAILPQMVNLAATVLNGGRCWQADTSEDTWTPSKILPTEKTRHILLLFTSVTFEHCAMILKKVNES